MIGRTISHYKILEKLGEGGMGVVYKAQDTKLDRFVALKFLPHHLTASNEERTRFLQEAKAASALNHQNVCTIYGIEEYEGQDFIEMEYVDGTTLREKIQNKPLKTNDAISYAIQVGDALQEAHGKGIVHRDIKADNIMVNTKNQIKVMDFGLAKLKGSLKLTRSSSTVGTLAYMAPEQIQGGEVDARSDIFSFGVVLYEMLTGRTPFRGEHDAAMMYSILNEEPDTIQKYDPDASSELVHVLGRALEKDPEDRYQSASEMVIDLRRLKKETTKVSRQFMPHLLKEMAPAVSWKRRQASFIIASIAIGILAVGVLIYGLTKWFTSDVVTDISMGEKNSIAVMYFENLTGDSSLDWVEAGMVEMLTSNLGRYEELEVLSSQRLFDIMRQVTGGSARKIDRSIATQIAQKAGARTMLLGNVVKMADRIRLNAQLVEVPSGKLAGSEVLDTGPRGSLFSLVDSLTIRLVSRLGIAVPQRVEEVGISYSLTNSPEALQLYVEGIQALYGSKYKLAIDDFEAATRTDSSFALAYYYLAWARAWGGTGGWRAALQKAWQFKDKISEREQLFIQAGLLETLREQKKALEQIVERYPNEKIAWYQLGELQFHNYWPRSAVNSFLKAIELDPHFLLAYVHPIDYYAMTTDPAKARPLLSRVLAVDSLNTQFLFNEARLNWNSSKTAAARDGFNRVLRIAGEETVSFDANFARAFLAMMDGQYHKVDRILKQLMEESPGYKSTTRDVLAGYAVLRGKFKLAEVYIQENLKEDPTAFDFFEAGEFYLLQKKLEPAKMFAEKIMDLYNSNVEPFVEVATLGWHLHFSIALARGDHEKAQMVVSNLEGLAAERENNLESLYYHALGRLAYDRDDLDEAQAHFRRALSLTTSRQALVLDELLSCLEEQGAYESLLQQVRNFPPFAISFIFPSDGAVWPRALIRKARAHEKLGHTEKAIESYEELLKIWEDADSDLPELINAKTELAKLKGTAAK